MVDTLTDALRNEIISGEIDRESTLTELQLAERFEVARSTVRASLDRLQREGLIRRGFRRGASVTQMTPGDIKDLYFCREPIESRAVELLARAGIVPEDAVRSLHLMRVAATTGAADEHTDADLGFHRSLIAGCGSERLRRMHGSVMPEMRLCIAQVRDWNAVSLDALAEQHSPILDAIKERDPDRAVECLLADLHICRDALLENGNISLSVTE